MAKVHHKMLGSIPADKIVETPARRFLTEEQKQWVANQQAGISSSKVTVGNVEVIGDYTIIPGDNMAIIADPNANTISFSSAGGGEGGSSDSIIQITKLAVTASKESPKKIEVIISNPTDFKYRPIEILKFEEGDTLITTNCEFDNSDKDDFIHNGLVEFDGTMKLKTEFTEAMIDNGILGEGREWSLLIDTSKLKSIEEIEVI